MELAPTQLLSLAIGGNRHEIELATSIEKVRIWTVCFHQRKESGANQSEASAKTRHLEHRSKSHERPIHENLRIQLIILFSTLGLEVGAVAQCRLDVVWKLVLRVDCTDLSQVF